jgi:hypothetical protein
MIRGANNRTVEIGLPWKSLIVAGSQIGGKSPMHLLRLMIASEKPTRE